MQDHHWTVSAAIRKPSSDWRRPVGRPRHTWLRAVESDLRPLNIGLSSAWRKAADRDAWRLLWARRVRLERRRTKRSNRIRTTVWDPKIWMDAVAHHLGVADLYKHALSHLRCHVENYRSRSNAYWGPPKKMAPRVPPFTVTQNHRNLQPTRIDWVPQKHPQIEHCYGQHRANRSRHAVMADFGSAQINILTIAGNCKPMQSVIITGAATIVAGIDMGNNYM